MASVLRLEARLRAVSLLGDDRALAFARGDGGERLILDIDPTSLAVNRQAWNGPELDALESVEIDGEWVLAGTGRVEGFVTGLISACDLSRGTPTCKAMVTHGGISTELEHLARVGPGLAFTTRRTVVAVPRWPRVAEVTVVSTLNDEDDRLGLSGGAALPAWIYTLELPSDWLVRALAASADQAFVCASGIRASASP